MLIKNATRPGQDLVLSCSHVMPTMLGWKLSVLTTLGNCLRQCVSGLHALDRVGFIPKTFGYGVGYGRPQTLGSGLGLVPVPP